MKTITLTDEQFDTLFDYVDNKVQFIVDASVKHQDSEILEAIPMNSTLLFTSCLNLKPI